MSVTSGRRRFVHSTRSDRELFCSRTFAASPVRHSVRIWSTSSSSCARRTCDELTQRAGPSTPRAWRRCRRGSAAAATGGAWGLVNAADYGVAQLRHRVLFIGYRDDLGIEPALPDATHSKAALLAAQADGSYWAEHGLEPRAPLAARTARTTLEEGGMRRWRTLRDAIGDLPEPRDGRDHAEWHNHVGIPAQGFTPGIRARSSIGQPNRSRPASTATLAGSTSSFATTARTAIGRFGRRRASRASLTITSSRGRGQRQCARLATPCPCRSLALLPRRWPARCTARFMPSALADGGARRRGGPRDSAMTSRMMAAVKHKGSKAELALRHELHRRGLRYRLHAPELRGRPDVVFRRWRVAVFVDGDLWHGTRKSGHGEARKRWPRCSPPGPSGGSQRSSATSNGTARCPATLRPRAGASCGYGNTTCSRRPRRPPIAWRLNSTMPGAKRTSVAARSGV